MKIEQVSIFFGRFGGPPARGTVIGICALAGLYSLFAPLGLVFRPEQVGSLPVLRGQGIALAAFLTFGVRLWPGILIGAVALQVGLPSSDLVGRSDWGATLMVTASTLQPVLASVAIKRLFGSPISFRGIRDALVGIGVVLPAVTMISAAAGTLILVLESGISSGNLVVNYLTWWLGDLISIFFTVPLALLGRWNHIPRVFWKGKPLPLLDGSSIAYVVLSIAVTVGAWSFVNRTVNVHAREQFSGLVNDSEHALVGRISSYGFALDAGRSLFDSSHSITLGEWQRFVHTIISSGQLPKINGLGFIAPVKRDGIDAFLAEAAANGVADLKIKPETQQDDLFVIEYIEPIAENIQAVGLNIASEANRAEAAIAARDSGHMRMTKKITLVQAATSGAGFLILAPVYANDLPTSTVEERRAAFLGWVFAPFVASRMMSDLPASQADGLYVTVYDGDQMQADNLLFQSQTGLPNGFVSRFNGVRTISLFGRHWTVSWSSTPDFEARLGPSPGIAILVGGLAFSTLLTILLLSLSRREERVRQEVDDRTRELAAQVNQKRSILDTAVTNIALMDGEGRMLVVNDALLRLFGCERNMLLGRPLSSFLSEEIACYFARTARESARGPFRGEVVGRHISGREIILDVHIQAWETEDGERRHTAVMDDLTEKRGVERELDDTRRRMEIALTGAKIGVFDVDLQTSVSVVSDTWKSILGFDPDAQIDTQAEWRKRIHPADWPHIETADRDCIEGRTERSIAEYRFRVNDGSWRWMCSDAVAIGRGAGGRALRLVGVQTDITEQVSQKENLRMSEELFRTAIEGTTVGMALVDLEGRVTKANEALGAFLGVGSEELIERGYLHFIHPDDRAEVVDRARCLFAGEEKSFQAETRYISSSGALLWGHLGVAIILDSAGGPLNFVVQVLDITEQKRLDQTKSEFVSTVSHELRTPLTSINGSLSLVLNVMKNEISTKAHSMLTIAQKNTDRLMLLVNDLLDVETLAGGNIHLTITRTDILDLVRNSVRDNQPLADKFGVHLDVRLPVGKLFASIDPSRFQQVLANLLSNAVKFSTKNGTVEVSALTVAGVVMITVTDHGRGISHGNRSRIFKPFSQVDSSSTRDREGTGLGLHIVKQLVEKMGGATGFDSEPGVQTTFWVGFPLDQGRSASAEPLRILLIDSDQDFAGDFSASFGRLAEIVSATRTSRALDLLATRQFDLVVLGPGVPDGSPSRLLDHIQDLLPRAPVIMLTAAKGAPADPRVTATAIKSCGAFLNVVVLCLRTIRFQGAEAADEVA